VRCVFTALGYGSVIFAIGAGCRFRYDDIATDRLNQGSASSGGAGGSAGDTNPLAGSGGSSSTGGSIASSSGGTENGASGGGAGGAVGGAGGESGGSGGQSGGSGSDGGSGSTGGVGGSSDAGLLADAASLGDCRALTYAMHSYLFCNVKVEWSVARDNCASIGMQLVRVDDAGENQFLLDNMYATAPVSGIWIGASDAAVEGEWRWVDGTLFWLGAKNGMAQNGLYNDWYAGTQPAGQQASRDCAALDRNAGGGWFDSDCPVAKEYACESL
jgi:hypothetical protein